MHLASLPSRRADARPDSPCLSDEAVGTLTNEAFAARVEAASRVLAAHGVARGAVVAVRLPNRVDLVVSLFAAWRLGAVVTPVNPALADAEAEYQVVDSSSRVLVTHDGLALKGVTTLMPEDLTSPGDGIGVDAAEPDLDDLALLVYTSGTTGYPKGVELTHANLDAMTGTMVESLELDERDHSLLILPLFHVNGIVVSVLSPLRAGGQATIARRFNPQTFFTTLETVRPTYCSGVPAIYTMLANLPAEIEPDTSSLRFVACGAAPMPADLIGRIEHRFGVVLIEGYGLSEGTCASTSNPLNGVRKPGTVGVALPGQRVAVMAPDGTLVPPGERGEIVIQGPTVMRGYLNRPQETAQALKDGWLHTGDVGILDEDGYLRIVDRVKDMIIRGGENIYPQEIEHAIHAHPAVLEAAVVGRPHPVMGEEPVAFVALKDGASLDEDEVVAFLTQRIAKFKLPTSVTFVDDVPKNSVSKFDKPRLRATLAPTGTSAMGRDEERP
ncbi:class I adenylate-forming enzyme family protein [Streptomyces sp. NBC_01012]|uniref:AMP-binding protein n=1 Tax=Streptomyces sp. NBC_01401 TaxID=2903854 RepID=A0AAU3GS64_9ACTN|nr:AMP-binding protein [Streptomyces sp. NBC_01012]